MGMYLTESKCIICGTYTILDARALSCDTCRKKWTCKMCKKQIANPSLKDHLIEHNAGSSKLGNEDVQSMFVPVNDQV